MRASAFLFAAGTIALPASLALADISCQMDDDSELQHAIDCVLLGPKIIADRAREDGISLPLPQAKADCATAVAKFRASGLTKRDAGLLDGHDWRPFICSDGRWRVQVEIEPGIMWSTWKELPSGKTLQSSQVPLPSNPD